MILRSQHPGGYRQVFICGRKRGDLEFVEVKAAVKYGKIAIRYGIRFICRGLMELLSA
jgi:hypothetical protein